MSAEILINSFGLKGGIVLSGAVRFGAFML